MVRDQQVKTELERLGWRVIDDRKYESGFDRMVKLVPGKKDECAEECLCGT